MPSEAETLQALAESERAALEIIAEHERAALAGVLAGAIAEQDDLRMRRSIAALPVAIWYWIDASGTWRSSELVRSRRARRKVLRITA